MNLQPDQSESVLALRELYEASAPYQPRVEGVNAEDDRLSAARWAAGMVLGKPAFDDQDIGRAIFGGLTPGDFDEPALTTTVRPSTPPPDP
jgi:hypothetical protein